MITGVWVFLTEDGRISVRIERDGNWYTVKTTRPRVTSVLVGKELIESGTEEKDEA